MNISRDIKNGSLWNFKSCLVLKCIVSPLKVLSGVPSAIHMSGLEDIWAAVDGGGCGAVVVVGDRHIKVARVRILVPTSSDFNR